MRNLLSIIYICFQCRYPVVNDFSHILKSEDDFHLCNPSFVVLPFENWWILWKLRWCCVFVCHYRFSLNRNLNSLIPICWNKRGFQERWKKKKKKKREKRTTINWVVEIIICVEWRFYYVYIIQYPLYRHLKLIPKTYTNRHMSKTYEKKSTLLQVTFRHNYTLYLTRSNTTDFYTSTSYFDIVKC